MCKAIEEMLEDSRDERMDLGMELLVALLNKLTPGSEEYMRAMKGTAVDRRELLKKYGIKVQAASRLELSEKR